MATKLDTRPPKKGRRVLGGKRVIFDRGQAKVDGDGLPLKTSEKKE